MACFDYLKRHRFGVKGETTFQKLHTKIKNDTGLILNNFERCYPGYWQRARGAWVWSATIDDTIAPIGSIYSATYLLKCKKVIHMGNEIGPSSEK